MMWTAFMMPSPDMRAPPCAAAGPILTFKQKANTTQCLARDEADDGVPTSQGTAPGLKTGNLTTTASLEAATAGLEQHPRSRTEVAHLQEVVRGHQLRAPGAVEQAVHIQQGHAAPCCIHALHQEVCQLQPHPLLS